MDVDGNAIVYCEGGFGTTNGKTAHGLVRFTERYRVLSVIDSLFSGKRLDNPGCRGLYLDCSIAGDGGPLVDGSLPGRHCVARGRRR